MGGRGGPPFRGGSRGGFNRGGGFPNNTNNQGGPPLNNQFYPNENFNPMNGGGGGGGGGNPDFHHPQGPGPMPMMNNRMPGPPQMMHRPHGPPGPVGMRPDFHPNMQQGNFGRPPFQNEGPRPNMMRPPFDQQPHFGGGPPMNAYRPHPRMPDQMNMGPRGRPPFPPHYGPNNFNPNRMNGPPQQFGGGVGGPPQMQPYPQQAPLPQRPPMNQQPMMGGGGIGPGQGPVNMPPSGHNAVGMAPMLPRKVLINPNFKGGGVEAATSE